MPMNLIKKYPDLLELLQFSEHQRKLSLLGIYKRDIENNDEFIFRKKKIYPIKSDGKLDMQRQFIHLTCEEVQEKDDLGNLLPSKRIFDIHRSQRLHWLKPHIEEKINDSKIFIFSKCERNQQKRKDVLRTYIYNQTQKYVIVFEPQTRNGQSYYLLTAYYLNKEFGERQLKKKMDNKLDEII